MRFRNWAVPLGGWSTLLLALSVIGVITQDSFGFGHRRRGRCCQTCCCTNGNSAVTPPTVPVMENGTVDFSNVDVQDLLSKVGNVPKGPDINQKLLDKLIKEGKVKMPSPVKGGGAPAPAAPAPAADDEAPAPSA